MSSLHLWKMYENDGEEMETDCCRHGVRKVFNGFIHCMRSLLARAVMLLVLVVCGRWNSAL